MECDLASATRAPGREELIEGSGRREDVVQAVLRGLGGRARLPEVYAAMLGRRPTDNPANLARESASVDQHSIVGRPNDLSETKTGD